MIRKALFFSLALQPAQFLLQFAYGVITARLMSPDEKGVFGGAVALFSLIQMLQAFGSGGVLIRSRADDAVLVDRLLALLCTTSVVTALIAFFGASALADWTSEPRIAPVLHVLGLTLLLGPLELICGGLLQREMRFGQLAICGLAKTVATCVVGVWLVQRGYSYLGQAWGMVAGTLVYTVATFLFTRAGFPTRLDWRLPRSLLASLTHVFASQSGSVLSDRMSTAALLRLQGSASVGVYGLAAGLCDVARQSFSDPALRVFQPAWARSMHTPVGLAPLLGRALELTSVVLFPAYLVLAVLAEPIVVTIYGAAWFDAAMMLKWLAASAAVATLSFGFLEVLLVTNRTGLMFLVQTGLSVVSFALFVIGAHIDMEAVAASRFLLAMLSVAAAWYVFVRLAAMTTARLARHFAASVLVGVTAASAAWLALQGLAEAAPAVRAAGGLAAGVVAWLAAVVGTRHPVCAELRHGVYN